METDGLYDLESSVEGYATGVDWLSAVTHNEKVAESWQIAFDRAKGKSALPPEDWAMAGGFYGKQIDGWRMGYSSNYGYIIIASSNSADDLTRYMFRANVRDYRVTRIDLRMDVMMREVTDIAGGIYEANKNRKSPGFRLVQSPTGSTVYVGSMSSDMFCRIYDKGGQLGEDLGLLWRYEVCVRKPYGDEVYDRLRDRYLGTGEYGSATRDFVCGWLIDRHVRVPVVHNWMEQPEYVKPLTTVETKLAWLRRSVSGTVKMLIDAGHKSEVLDALGIPDRFAKP